MWNFLKIIFVFATILRCHGAEDDENRPIYTINAPLNYLQDLAVSIEKNPIYSKENFTDFDCSYELTQNPALKFKKLSQSIKKVLENPLLAADTPGNLTDNVSQVSIYSLVRAEDLHFHNHIKYFFEKIDNLPYVEDIITEAALKISAFLTALHLMYQNPGTAISTFRMTVDTLHKYEHFSLIKNHASQSFVLDILTNFNQFITFIQGKIDNTHFQQIESIYYKILHHHNGFSNPNVTIAASSMKMDYAMALEDLICYLKMYLSTDEGKEYMQHLFLIHDASNLLSNMFMLFELNKEKHITTQISFLHHTKFVLSNLYNRANDFLTAGTFVYYIIIAIYFIVIEVRLQAHHL